MKFTDIFEALPYPSLKYDADTKNVLGSTTEWLSKLGITKENIDEVTKKALTDLKVTAAWKDAEKLGLEYSSTARELKNGTLAFTSDVKVRDKYPQYRSFKNNDVYVYNIYGNGQIRQYAKGGHVQNKTGITRLASPKPRVTADDPVKSLRLTWENALKEVNKKYEAKLKSLK